MPTPRRDTVALALTLLLAACSDSAAPIGENDQARVRPTFDVVDATTTGNKHLLMLPELVPAPGPALIFNNDQKLYPTIDICELGGTQCVARFIRTASGDPNWRIGVGSNFSVEWKTALSALDPSKDYRVSVRLGAFKLGHADLDVLDAAGPAPAQRAGFVQLRKGGIARFRFRIRQDAFQRIGPIGQSVVVHNGRVHFTLPKNSLLDEEYLNVEPMVSTEPLVMRNTAFEMALSSGAFLKPVKLAVKYDPTSVPGLDESALKLYRFDNGAWTAVAGSTVDAVGDKVSAMITQLGTYAILRGAAPAPVVSYSITTNANPAVGGTTSGDGTFTAGSSATVNATPSAGYRFLGWSENGTAVSAVASYNFQVNGNRQLVAGFELIQHLLTLQTAGFGSGTIVSAAPDSPLGPSPSLFCVSVGGMTTGTCSGMFVQGTPVTLTAMPFMGATFGGWVNCPNPVGDVCNTTIQDARSITATFNM